MVYFNLLKAWVQGRVCASVCTGQQILAANCECEGIKIARHLQAQAEKMSSTLYVAAMQAVQRKQLTFRVSLNCSV